MTGHLSAADQLHPPSPFQLLAAHVLLLLLLLRHGHLLSLPATLYRFFELPCCFKDGSNLETFFCVSLLLSLFSYAQKRIFILSLLLMHRRFQNFRAISRIDLTLKRSILLCLCSSRYFRTLRIGFSTFLFYILLHCCFQNFRAISRMDLSLKHYFVSCSCSISLDFSTLKN